MDSAFGRYFDPEHPWVRGVFDDNDHRGRMDDTTSYKIASVTGWKGAQDDQRHRYHNAILMMNVTTDDLAYHHLFKFLIENKVLERASWATEYEAWLWILGMKGQLLDSTIRGFTLDDIISVALLVS